MIHTVTNLYPYPANPTRGLFNLQLFRELGKLTKVRNNVLVANPNPLRASHVRKWTPPPDVPAATYLPYQHIPIIGRNLTWRFIARALRGVARDYTSQPKCSARLHLAARPTGGNAHSVLRTAGEVQPRATSKNPQPTGHSPLPTSILASWLYPDGSATAMAFRNSDIPVWTMVLGTDRFHLNSPYRRQTILRADRHTTGYICVSQNIADDLVNGGIPPNKIHVIRNGVDTTRFHPIPREESVANLITRSASSSPFQVSGINLHPFPLLLFIGNLVPVKAPDLALRAFAVAQSASSGTSECGAALHDAARPTGGNAHSVLRTAGEVQPRATPSPRALRLVFIGDGPMRPALEKLAAELQIADRVHFLGKRPHNEIPLWLNAADALLLSSRSEGMPNAVAEALACGCPVVATDVGACREMLADQPCCAVTPFGNAQAMAKAIRLALSDAEKTQKRPKFTRTWADMAQDILALATADLMMR